MDRDVRAALRALDPRGELATHAVVMACLDQRFPAACAPVASRNPPVADPTPESVESFRAALRQSFRHAPSHRAPGLGGARGELWSFQARHDSWWFPIEALLTRFALGQVPPSLLRMWHAGRLVPLAKGASDIRPLMLAYTPSRLTEKAIATVFSGRVEDIMKSQQYCMAKSGAELMHKTMHCALSVHTSSSLYSYDVENAHSSIERGPIMDEVGALLPEMTPWIHPLLVTPTTIVHHDDVGHAHFHTTTRGLGQGRPLSNLLYPLATHRANREAHAAACRHDNSAVVGAYQDDVNFVTTPAAESAARSALLGQYACLGLTLQSAKSTVYTPAGRSGAQTTDLRRVDRPVVLKHGMSSPIPVVPDPGSQDGTFLGTDCDESAALLRARQQLCQTITRLHDCGLSTQMCTGLLRVATSGDFTFMARAVGLPAQVQCQLDHTLQTTLSTLWHTPLDEQQLVRTFLPLRLGGLGFSRVSWIADVAHAASWLSAMDHIFHACGVRTIPELAQQVHAFEPIARTLPSLMPAGTDTPAALLVETPGAIPTQRQLLEGTLQQHHSALVESIQDRPPLSAMLRSMAGPGSGLWCMLPEDELHLLEDSQFRRLVRLRLGEQPPTAQLIEQVGGGVVRRHDAVRDAVIASLRDPLLGLSHVDREQIVVTASPDSPNSRLDVIAVLGDGTKHYLDVTIAVPTTVTALRAGSSETDGAAAAALEAHKRTKYSALHVTPFVLEAGGRHGEAAAAFLRRAAHALPADDRAEWIRRTWQSVSVAMQRRIALALLT